MAYTDLVRLLQIWLAWSLAFFFCIAAPAQAMSASKALASPLATKLDTHYFPINNTDPNGLKTALIYSGPISINPLGHTAITITNQGVYNRASDSPIDLTEYSANGTLRYLFSIRRWSKERLA